MSANNFILIKERPKDTYTVSHNDMDNGKPYETFAVTTSLKQACQIAQNHQAETEYGVLFNIKKM